MGVGTIMPVVKLLTELKDQKEDTNTETINDQTKTEVESTSNR